MSVETKQEGAEAPGLRVRLSEVTSTYFEYLMSLPSFVYVILVVGFPTAYLLYLSVMQDVFTLVGSPTFVGAENIVAVLTSGEYWVFFGNTILYAVAVVGGGIVLQIGIALALNVDLPYQRFWQTLIILPWAIPFVVSTLIWKLMFNPQFGLINYLLMQVGLVGEPVAWFSSKGTAFFAVVITTIWVNTPLAVLILLAGLKTIPNRMYEAARLDGAGVWNRFRHVTLPQLRPALTVVLLIESLLALRGFDIIFAMTEGGPGTATTVIAIDVYRQLIQFGNVGYAAAESLVLIVTVLIFLALLIKYMKTDYGEV